MNIKKAYYYLFYKFYKFGERSPSSLPSDYTAILAISVLEVLFLGALKFYYIEFIDQNNSFEFFSFQTLVPLIAVLLLNYFAFFKNDRWKEYVNEFNQWPRKRNIIGTWIVIGIVVFIIVNMVVAIHIMGQITGIN